MCRFKWHTLGWISPASMCKWKKTMVTFVKNDFRNEFCWSSCWDLKGKNIEKKWNVTAKTGKKKKHIKYLNVRVSRCGLVMEIKYQNWICSQRSVFINITKIWRNPSIYIITFEIFVDIYPVTPEHLHQKIQMTIKSYSTILNQNKR